MVGKRRFLAFQLCVTRANLSPVSKLKGRATIVARHVSEKVRSESILYLRLVLIDQRKSSTGPQVPSVLWIRRMDDPIFVRALIRSFSYYRSFNLMFKKKAQMKILYV